ncbi:MAG: N-6 DNA methylase [Planctomycetota bacterium]
MDQKEIRLTVTKIDNFLKKTILSFDQKNGDYLLPPYLCRGYLIVIFFIKYLTDNYKDEQQTFSIPAEYCFDELYENRDSNKIHFLIKNSFEEIVYTNREKLKGLIKLFHLDLHGERKNLENEQIIFFKTILEIFSCFNLKISQADRKNVEANNYDYLLAYLSDDDNKYFYEFCTSSEISYLLTKLLAPKPGDRIYDPICNVGSVLAKMADELREKNCSMFGQTNVDDGFALCKINMITHEKYDAYIEDGDIFEHTEFIENGQLMKFDIVVSSIPYKYRMGYRYENLKKDPYNRFHRGIPPVKKMEYSIISHMIESAVDGKGKVGVVVPYGVLFRRSVEGKIRQKLVEENLVDIVVGLPPNLFYKSGGAEAILIFNKGKKDQNVLFIDASHEYEPGKNQNKLRTSDINKILSAFEQRKTIEKYSYLASLQEIEKNNFNLSVSRYVDTFKKEIVDLTETEKKIDGLETDIKNLQALIRNISEELEK